MDPVHRSLMILKTPPRLTVCKLCLVGSWPLCPRIFALTRAEAHLTISQQVTKELNWPGTKSITYGIEMGLVINRIISTPKGSMEIIIHAKSCLKKFSLAATYRLVILMNPFLTWLSILLREALTTTTPI